MPELRLVAVANKGWKEDAVLAAMRPHVENGRLIHLESVPADEVGVLQRQAMCFVFPSFNEGFGYPPLEALEAGTAVIVADIPVFRWVFGQAALYVDPYSTQDIAMAIERLTCHPGRAALRAELLSHRASVIERFRASNIAGLWEDLLRQPIRPPVASE
jgi:glycosyltransferase involved in cell wall biosynthesis